MTNDIPSRRPSCTGCIARVHRSHSRERCSIVAADRKLAPWPCTQERKSPAWRRWWAAACGNRRPPTNCRPLRLVDGWPVLPLPRQPDTGDGFSAARSATRRSAMGRLRPQADQPDLPRVHAVAGRSSPSGPELVQLRPATVGHRPTFSVSLQFQRSLRRKAKGHSRWPSPSQPLNGRPAAARVWVRDTRVRWDRPSDSKEPSPDRAGSSHPARARVARLPGRPRRTTRRYEQDQVPSELRPA